MNIVFVVSQPSDWPFDIPGVTVIPAQTYLLDHSYEDGSSTAIFNLCRSFRYQSHGYYVSLLAEARGHQPSPGMEAINDLQSDDLLQNLGERLGDLLDCAFCKAKEDAVALDIYFGREATGRHEHLCAQIFRQLRIPILHVRAERAHGQWRLSSVHAGDIGGIPPGRRGFFMKAAVGHLKDIGIRAGKPTAARPTLAILHDPGRPDAPSNPQALSKFCEAAEALGMNAEIIAPKDVRRLHEFDALFIRTTTSVNNSTYRISRQAAHEGMVVIDDPNSILRCTNKIYLAELLTRHHIPTPRTMVVHRENVDRIATTLGLPCVLKQPDGAFSRGVARIGTEQELQEKVQEFLRKSELILAQEYLPTRFDWRIGVLDQRPLFVCKYYMAPGHWQVLKHERHRTSEGRTEALSVGEAPDEAVKLALQAASLIGQGLYGVDLKQIGNQYYVIEINDNPNVDTGNEDGVLGDALYREVMGVFRKRIDALKGNPAP